MVINMDIKEIVDDAILQAREDTINEVIHIIDDDIKLEGNEAVKFVLQSLRKEIQGL